MDRLRVPRISAIAFDRAAMLDGQPATAVAFSIPGQGGVLPSDMDGKLPPPDGSPNYFMTWNTPPAELWIWQFHADFATPANTTFTGPVTVPVADFNVPICGSSRDQCVPQLDSGELLETLSQATMFRMAYRNFGDHESLVTNHTVDVATAMAGVRWYEIRNPGGLAGPSGGVAGRLPAGDLRSRFQLAVDGLDRPGRQREHGARLQHLVSGDVSLDRHHGPARERSAGHDGRGEHLARGDGQPGIDLLAMGRLQLHDRRPARRLHLLVHQRVLPGDRVVRLEHPHCVLQVPGCTAPGHRHAAGTVTDGTNPIAGAKVTAGSRPRPRTPRAPTRSRFRSKSPLRHGRDQVRLLPRLRERRRGHGGRRHDPGLRARGGAVDRRQRRREGRLGRRLAALRQHPDHRGGRADLHSRPTR